MPLRNSGPAEGPARAEVPGGRRGERGLPCYRGGRGAARARGKSSMGIEDSSRTSSSASVRTPQAAWRRCREEQPEGADRFREYKQQAAEERQEGVSPEEAEMARLRERGVRGGPGAAGRPPPPRRNQSQHSNTSVRQRVGPMMRSGRSPGAREYRGFGRGVSPRGASNGRTTSLAGTALRTACTVVTVCNPTQLMMRSGR